MDIFLKSWYRSLPIYVNGGPVHLMTKSLQIPRILGRKSTLILRPVCIFFQAVTAGVVSVFHAVPLLTGPLATYLTDR